MAMSRDHLVTGVAPATTSRGGGRRSKAAESMRGRGRAGGCPFGPRAHQERDGMDGEGRGGRTASRRCPDGSGQNGGEGDGDDDLGTPTSIPRTGR